jgi:nucleoside-diphosphate-sugar epimerase
MAIDGEPHVLLLGGGYTLQRVAELLPQESFVITSRSAETCAEWRARGWNAHQVNLEDRESILSLLKVYPHLRQIVDSVPPLREGSDPAAGVKNLLSTLNETKIERIIYLSTTGVFGVRDGSIVTEETPSAPWNPQGQARRTSEEAYRASAIAFTALRLPAIYGFDRGLLFSIRSGRYRMVEGGAFWSNRIHVEDLARVIVGALGVKELPPVLCVSDDEPARTLDVVRYVCEREKIPLPGSVAAGEVLKSGGFTMLSNQRVRNDLMKKVLGIHLVYPTYREGFYPPATR